MCTSCSINNREICQNEKICIHVADYIPFMLCERKIKNLTLSEVFGPFAPGPFCMFTICGPVAVIVHTLLTVLWDTLGLLIFHSLDESVKIERSWKMELWSDTNLVRNSVFK